jgi:hypothetical protein
MKRRRPAASVLLVATCLAASAVARADPDAAAQAQALFDEGLTLLAKPKAPGDAHAYEDAIAKFLAAYRLSPRPNALFNAALTEEKIARPADAIRHFRQLAHNPACSAELRSQIEKHIADLSAKVATVLLDAPAGADIAVDGAPTGDRAPLPDPIDLSPGRHTIEAKLGVSASIEIDAVAGTKQTLRIGLVAPPSPPSTERQPAPTAPSSLPSAPPHDPASVDAQPLPGPTADSMAIRTPFWSTRRTVGVVIAGAGVASLVASGVFQVTSSHQRDQAAAIGGMLGPSSCYGPSPSAPTSCASLNDAFAAQNRDEDLSRVFLAAGIAGVALGAVIVLWPQAAPARTAIVPVPMRQGAGLQLEGEL